MEILQCKKLVCKDVMLFNKLGFCEYIFNLFSPNISEKLRDYYGKMETKFNKKTYIKIDIIKL